VPAASLGPAGDGFDVVAYQLGNSHQYHTEAYRALLRRPGVVTLHEFGLHDLIRDVCLAARRPDLYVEELRYCGGRYGAATGQRYLDLGVPVDPRAFPLFERVVDRSLAVVVHNAFAAARVRRSRPAAVVHRIPQPASLLDDAGATPPTHLEARRRLGIDPGECVIAVFGHVTPTRRLGVLARAVARLRATLSPTAAAAVRLHLVGEVSPHYDLDADLPPGSDAWVVRHGRVSRDELLLRMAGCDIAANLRYPSLGETSATLTRLLGLGRAVIVSDTGGFAELPDDCVAKVELDETELETLVALLGRLREDTALRAALGASARRRYETHHTPAVAAVAYATALRAAAALPPAAFVARPPLAAPAADDALSDLITDVTTGMVDLVGGEPDDELLAAVAAPINDLFGA
jgi:glycosyltransferase involved in cell wall biosynthesis